jgi:hypothetical protein
VTVVVINIIINIMVVDIIIIMVGVSKCGHFRWWRPISSRS